MQLQYYFESKSHTIYDNQYRVELWRKDYLGGAIEIEKGASEPFNIDYPDTGSNFNVYYPIWGSNFTFTFVQQHNCTLENILTDDERTIKLVFYRNGFVEWTGWVVPDLCSDSVNNKNYFITVKATDGLGLLKDVNILTEAVSIQLTPQEQANLSWNWSGQVLTTTITQTQKSVLEIIKICLDKIELDLGIAIDNDLFETSLNSDERVFEKVLVDYQIYQSSGKSYTCLDVITSLLTSLNCVIVQSEGKWQISRINYLESRFIIREKYDNAGVYLESDEIDNQLDFTLYNAETNKSWYWLYDGHSRILRNPYRFKNFIYEYKEPVNLITDSWYFITDSMTLPLTFVNGEDTTITKITRTNKLPLVRIQNNDKFMYDNLHPFTTLNIFRTGLVLPEIEILSRLEYELSFDIIADLFFMYFEFTSNGVKYYWNINEDFWKTSYPLNSESELKSIIQRRTGITQIVGNNRGGFDTLSTQGTITIKLPKFPTNGTLKVWVKGGESTVYVQGNSGSVPALRNYIDYLDIKFSSSNGLVKETHSFENVKKVSFSADDTTVYNGDGFKGFYGRSNFTLKDTNYQTTKLWKDSTNQEPTNLLAFSARSIINNYSKRRTVIQGTLASKEKIRIGSLLSFDSYDKLNDKKLLVIPPFSYDPCTDKYEVTLFELSCGSAEGVLSEYYLDSSEFPLYENIVPYSEIVCEDFIGLNEGRFFEFGIFQDNQLWIEVEGEGVFDTAIEGRFFEFGVTINDDGWIEVEGEGKQDDFFQISNMFVLENMFISDSQTLLVLDITNVLIEKTSTIKATVLVNNPNNLLLEYSLNNSTYQNSNVFEGLYSTNKFYIRVVSDNSIIRTFDRVETIDSNNFALNSLDNKVRKLNYTIGTILDVSYFAITPQKTYTDENGYIRPMWAVWWDLYHNSFTQYNLKAWNVGLAGLVYGGEINEDPAKDGIDYKNSDYYTFVSAIPYQNRGHNQYNAVYGTEPWYSGSLEQIYDMGTEVGQSNMLGGGDNVDNQTLRGIVMADVENNDENGSIKHRVFLIGASRKTKGYFSSIYGAIFNTLGYTIELDTGLKRYYNYPNPDGSYPSSANLNSDWLLNTRTTLLSRNIDNESLLDYPNILPSTEYSLYYEQVAKQGGRYPLDTNGNYINVNKFGSDKSVTHPLCGLGYNMEIQAWYCRYKLNNRRSIFLPKLLADKSNLFGRNEYAKNYDGTFKTDSLLEHSNRNIGRKYAFLFTLLGFANGLDLEIWDRTIYEDNNSNDGIDTYSGVLGVIEMLTNNGIIEKYNELIPEYWDTEYSLDNGITWLKTKAIDWDNSTTDVLPVRIMKSENCVVLMAFRPEGVEPVEFIARAGINSEYKYFDISQNNWQTTDYEYKDVTDLSLIPIESKHYYCQVFNF